MGLRQILYTSQSARPMTEIGCRNILAKSHENNRRDGITGLLVHYLYGAVRVEEGGLALSGRVSVRFPERWLTLYVDESRVEVAS